jgi:hypothetical protein
MDDKLNTNMIEADREEIGKFIIFSGNGSNIWSDKDLSHFTTMVDK